MAVAKGACERSRPCSGSHVAEDAPGGACLLCGNTAVVAGGQVSCKAARHARPAKAGMVMRRRTRRT